MSKSILVIDAPNCCIDCPCHFVEDTGIVWCGIKKKVILANDIEVFKPDWCPLLDFPEKREVPIQYPQLHQLIADGWNACIDEILKGGETE